MIRKRLLHSVVTACVAVFLLSLTGCLKKSEKQRPYYYSEEEVDSHKEEGEKKVDIASIPEVRKFLAGKKFASKTYRIEFDDSLHAVLLNNGKQVLTAQCRIGEFMINDERLLLLVDETGKENRFTLANNGLLTDKSTYALYHRLEE
jgi:hypothetical protein